MTSRSLVLLSLLALLASCGGSETGETTTTDETTATAGGEDDEWEDWGEDDEVPTVESRTGAIEALGITPPEQPWAEMSHDAREFYMIGKVLPIMKELFNGHDAERFQMATYECETCHGETMHEVNYEMPPMSSFRVPAAGTPAYTNMQQIFPEVVAFMEQSVTPTMGTLMGMEDYTCQGCHPAAE